MSNSLRERIKTIPIRSVKREEYNMKHVIPKKKRKTKPMTVCIAAICADSAIVGASDRMITSGDIEFERNQMKIWIFSPGAPHIVAMVAGDMAVHAEILRDISKIIGECANDSSVKWSVKDVAELYSRAYNEFQSKLAEKDILWPLGLDRESFHKRETEAPELVKRLTEDMQNFVRPNSYEIQTQVILAGADESGAQIYVVDDGKVHCETDIGFAAIGIGASHAESQFMFSGYTKYALAPEAILTVYQAKRRAEVAPGVGKETDLYVLCPPIFKSPAPVSDEYIQQLSDLCDRQKTEAEDSNKAVQAQLKEAILNLAKPMSPDAELKKACERLLGMS